MVMASAKTQTLAQWTLLTMSTVTTFVIQLILACMTPTMMRITILSVQTTKTALGMQKMTLMLMQHVAMKIVVLMILLMTTTAMENVPTLIHVLSTRTTISTLTVYVTIQNVWTTLMRAARLTWVPSLVNARRMVCAMCAVVHVTANARIHVPITSWTMWTVMLFATTWTVVHGMQQTTSTATTCVKLRIRVPRMLRTMLMVMVHAVKSTCALMTPMTILTRTICVPTWTRAPMMPTTMPTMT
mmetsp:Transcript_25944/g.38331  ORF Transcript_25944/g.38331 Transcript_25944/m.38331 type:complete len:243 (-) Transcript_25944:5668-6396(-)